jgi:hypothetical protein
MKNILKMLFGGDFQSGVYENGGKVDTKLSIAEVEKIAKATANAIGSNFSVTKGSVDTATFDLDFKGEKYGGGSYLIMENGDVVNVALRGRPIYYNYKTKKKLEFGGDFQSGVYNKGGAVTNERRYVNKGEDYEVRYSKPRPKRKGYKGLRSFDDGGNIDLTDDKRLRLRKPAMPKRELTEAEWMAKHNESKEARTYGFGGSVKDSVDKHPIFVVSMYDKLSENKVILLLDKYQVKYEIISKQSVRDFRPILKILFNIKESKNPQELKSKIWDLESENIKITSHPMNPFTYGFGGLFSKSSMMSRPKTIDLNQQQVRLKSGEYVQVLSQQGDTLMVMDLTKLGTGTAPKYAKLSDVDMTSLAKGGGVGLIGNQKRIDMNKNGKIDAEDFKLLRSSMNGAWRNERKHVNHNEDYEVRYARKKPTRTGYKGKRKFATGGTVFKNRVKPTSQKMSSGAEVKKTNRGGVMLLAKKIRKEGESWKDALKRAGQQLK